LSKITIYTARENVDKDRFMFERIARAMKERRVFLIVPEQSTLRAEADAFDYMDAPGFIDFDVLSMTSLGRRILDEVGYGAAAAASGASDAGFSAPEFISKNGKFMLLSRLLYRRGKELRAFGRQAPSPDFVEKLSDMLAELKDHNVTPAVLREIASEIRSDSLLRRKIEDASLIYEGYEEAICGRYMDRTDHLKLSTSGMGRALFIPGAEFWFAGFDYLSPAVTDAVIALARYAASVNIVLTADAGGGVSDPLFMLTNGLAAELARRAGEAGVAAEIKPIPAGAADGYLRDLPPEIAHIERTLFTRPHTPFVCAEPPQPDAAAPQRTLRLIAAANYYAEAETAAAEIVGLVRDGLCLPGGGREEIRYRDILVLCNDMAERGPLIKRVFRRYGLPVFMDRRRSVEHNPVIEYLLALPRIAASDRRYEDVFTLLKTGLTAMGAGEIEELENYAVKYHIRGKRWDRDFTLGLKRHGEDGQTKGEYEQEELDALNSTRRKVCSLIEGFEEGFKEGRSAGERTDALRAFLTECARLPEMIEQYAGELEDAGMLEYAAEMSGMWSVADEILGQMSTVLGDLPMSMKEYEAVLRTGLDSVRIGVLPTVIDQIVLGTMQRTRSGSARAVFVLGANDGVLPASVGDAALFSEDEARRLADAGHRVARTEETARMEEELAIYRNLSKPLALLRVSYAASDSSGRNLSPSPVFERLRRLFPGIPVEKDIRNSRADALQGCGGAGPGPRRRSASPDLRRPGAPPSVQHPDETLDYLSDNMRAYVKGEPLPGVWKEVMAWYRVNRPALLARVEAGLTFRGRRERVDARFVDGLYRRVTSPSALERYSRCPFSWFMTYGLGLKERRVAGMDDRSIGDVYHSVLMRFGRELSADGIPVSEETSRWRTITDEEIDAAARRLTFEEYEERSAAELKGAGAEAWAAAAESYRRDRVSRTAALAARILTRQIREGATRAIYFESAFGKDGDFPPIGTERMDPAAPSQAAPAPEQMTFPDASGPSASARPSDGIRIEGRIDRVDVLDGGYARVIDYKSGAQEFSVPDAMTGYQLQLMLYLKAVAERYTPAGVFYFRIKEPRVCDEGGVDTESAIMRSMKLDGAAVDDERALTAMGMDPEGKSRKNRMESEEFDALLDAVGALVKDLAGRLSSGRIEAEPKTAVKLKTPANRSMKACDYCLYKGVCNYDVTLT
jgi:ATP-dependent helicase/nuclease subunit B